MASGSQRRLAYIREVTAGTTPSTPTLQEVRSTGGSGLNNERTSVTSNEIRADRAIITSRLGNNQPAVNLPLEMSYESYEEFMKDALGGTWLADYNVSISVNFTATTLETNDTSSWLDQGVAVGDFINIADAVTPANDGIYYVSAIGDSAATNDELTIKEADKTTDPTFTVEIGDTITLIGGYTGGELDASANNITVSSTNKTVTAATGFWLTAGLQAGDTVYFEGFSNAGNNGTKKITLLTDTVMTCSGDTFVNETLSSGDLIYMNDSAMLLCGLDLGTYTLEEGFVDVVEYHNTKGAKISSFSLSFQPDSVITGSFDFMGQTYVAFESTSIATAVTEPNIKPVFDAYTGNLYFGSDVGCVVTGLDFTLDNGNDRRFTLMKTDACSLSEGRTTVTGTVSAFFPDASLSNKFNDEEIFEVRIRTEDLDGNSYTFGWPRFKFTSDTRDISETDVTESFGFMALGGDDLSTMYIRKQPAKA